jgi:hypothetical protein
MSKQWIAEHRDADGLVNIADYEHYGDAKDVADQWWDEHKNQASHTVKVYHQPNPGGPRELVYPAGQAVT